MELCRAQIMLEKNQLSLLSQIARQESRSLSDLVREMLARELLYHERKEMQYAARELQAEYKTNAELIAFTALDGDDFQFEENQNAPG